MPKKCSLSIQFVDSERNRLYVVDVQMGGTSRYVDSLQEKKSDYCDLTETELSLVRPLLSSRHWHLSTKAEIIYSSRVDGIDKVLSHFPVQLLPYFT